MFKFRISKQFKNLFRLQLTSSTENDYLNTCISEYNLFQNFIKTPKTILELGCGLGRMSIFLNSQLQNSDIHYILADSTSNVKIPSYGWNANEGYYNDLNLTELFSKNHGMENFEIFDLKNDNIERLNDIDLIMSFLSVGFHYPIENYIDSLLKISSENCIMVFGIRRGRYSENNFKDHFKNIQIIENTTLFGGKRIKEDILILEDKK